MKKLLLLILVFFISCSKDGQAPLDIDAFFESFKGRIYLRSKFINGERVVKPENLNYPDFYLFTIEGEQTIHYGWYLTDDWGTSDRDLVIIKELDWKSIGYWIAKEGLLRLNEDELFDGWTNAGNSDPNIDSPKGYFGTNHYEFDFRTSYLDGKEINTDMWSPQVNDYSIGYRVIGGCGTLQYFRYRYLLNGYTPPENNFRFFCP
jgi:hypothetical protein